MRLSYEEGAYHGEYALETLIQDCRTLEPVKYALMHMVTQYLDTVATVSSEEEAHKEMLYFLLNLPREFSMDLVNKGFEEEEQKKRECLSHLHWLRQKKEKREEKQKEKACINQS